MKRALVIQVLIQGLKPRKIQEILEVSAGFISQCKTNYAIEGIEGMKLKYHGSNGYLYFRAPLEVIEWLKSKNEVKF